MVKLSLRLIQARDL